jgi:dimethylsulfoniopropionate demethylase
MKNFYIAKSRRLRSTLFTSRIESQGVTAYTTYNHMLLPASFGNLEKEYFHLKEHVQVWDVAAERQVQVTGKDSAKLVQLMTCRNLSKAKIGRCYYAPIIDEQGGMLNDPVVLKLDEDKWWLSLADSDIGLYAKGIASGLALQVEISEPDINIMAVQGPKSFKLMEKVLGKQITELKFFGFDYYTFKGNKFLIARSGWSKQGGYEVYVENREAGQNLYDELFSAGKEFKVEPGCPNLIERIESALLSAGNDFDSGDNPYECGFDKYIDIESDINYLGKKALIKLSTEGINRKLMGVLIDLDKIEIIEEVPLHNGSNLVGGLRSATYSPNLKKVVGIAMIKKEYWDKKTPIELKIGDKKSKGTLCELPIIP